MNHSIQLTKYINIRNIISFFSLTVYLFSFSITLSQEPLEFIKEGNLIWQKCNIGENPIDCNGLYNYNPTSIRMYKNCITFYRANRVKHPIALEDIFM